MIMRWPFSQSKLVGTIAIGMRPVSGPWGGSSVFVSQFETFLGRRAYAVRYDLKKPTDVIVIIDPRDDLQGKAFGMGEIIAYKKAHPAVKIMHRINECDQRKGTAFMDKLLAEANQQADFTVFISEWLCKYHADKWFDVSRPHAVVYNGADPAVFNPVGHRAWNGMEPFRIETHHWSDNPMKGFDVYQEVDGLLADGKLPGVELWVIGRWPADIRWKAARTFPPAHGHDLACLIRQCHVCLTASRWEPCGMHHVEAAQCGLPLIYHEDGGGIVEAGKRYGVGYKEDVSHAILECQRRYVELRRNLLCQLPSGDRMCMEYADIVQQLLS